MRLWSTADFVYLGTERATAELVVVDASQRHLPRIVATLDLPQSRGILSLERQGSILFAGCEQRVRHDEVFSIDVSDPARPRLIGAVDISVSASDMHLDGDFLYVAGNGTRELIKINVSRPSSIHVAGIGKFGWAHRRQRRERTRRLCLSSDRRPGRPRRFST